MSEVTGNKQDDSEEVTQPKNGKDRVRKVTNYLLFFVAFTLLFSVIADRIIPITDNARVKGYIVPIKPEVSGKVLDILVQPNQLVNQGDTLAILDESDYRIAVAQAEQNLEIAGQNVGAQTASIASAQAKLTSAIVERQNTKL
ncbi:biotin/lipoyl-binding protein, partial [Vibrio lentus]